MKTLKDIIKKHSDFSYGTGTLDETNIQAICNELLENQNEMWVEANRLYNLKEHTQDGRDLQMDKFIIIKK